MEGSLEGSEAELVRRTLLCSRESWLQAGGRDERNCGKCLWLVSMTSYQIR